ncbi:unnamed protein product [Plutella xylostella]|uniref:(diamondback moth) hypothetical protein n=1 Tax=Plutella xylostella TaxID=51655 RepID=A0A8S4DQ33_PLUXY|nr:unnamed protein product [Plutella xylostella]
MRARRRRRRRRGRSAAMLSTTRALPTSAGSTKRPYCQVPSEIIPEQAGVTYFNKKFISNVTFKAQFVFFESFGSSYKRSFVEFKGRLCDLFNDSLLTTLLADTGYTCPVPPGEKYMRNMSLTKTLRSLRSVQWPFSKAKVEGIVSQTYTKEIVAKGSIVLNFK